MTIFFYREFGILKEVFTPVGDLLKTLPRRSKTPGAIIALHVRRAFEDSLLTICGDLPKSVLAATRAKSFKNGVLTVECTGLAPVELQMRSGGLLREINRVLGRKIVFRLRFRVN
ncbi:DUF721 domain-containing protein [Candidatus Curtissbacteria bacterium]|nr:DUF721 domain-containing protein [Candidatus Curtissbacteria bacterium]